MRRISVAGLFAAAACSVRAHARQPPVFRGGTTRVRADARARRFDAGDDVIELWARSAAEMAQQFVAFRPAAR